MSDKFFDNSPVVYVTEASAGSGKTYALARHYARLLLKGGLARPGIESILAITFTNKAAREMKERILELLKRLAMDNFTHPGQKQDIISGLSLDEKEARRLASCLMEHIIENFSYFQVKTIDSFINMVLLGCAFRLGLSASFKIKDDRRDYLAYSLDDCIEQANYQKELRRVFDHFLRQYVNYGGNRGWLPKQDMLGLLSSLFYDVNIYGGNFKKFDLEGQDLFVAKRSWLKRLREFCFGLPEEVDGRFVNTLKNFLQKNADIFDFDSIEGKSTFLNDLPVKKGKTVPAELAQEWDEIRCFMRDLADKEARSFLNCYIDIFQPVYASLRRSTSSDDVIFLEELNSQANMLFGRYNLGVPELYFHIALRLRHLLIDEFQDTSRLQWDNLRLMVEEMLSTGGSLFYVGDKKQAIYRFRGGDVSLFDGIKNEFSRYVKEDLLKTNYRSRKEVVEFNNEVFSSQNLQDFLKRQQPRDNPLKQFTPSAMEEITGVFANSRQEYLKDGKHDGGYVRVEVLECRNKEERDALAREKLTALIISLRHGGRLPLNDIAVLCRDNNDVELVSGWFLEENIPIESEKTLNIKNNRLIKELLSLLAFLDSPIDNLSFAAFLLGDIFLSACGMSRRQICDFLLELRDRQKEEGFYLYREFERRYKGVWEEYFDGLFRHSGFVSLYEFIVDIYRTFSVLGKFPGQHGFLMRFLELIKTCEDEYEGIGGFLEFITDLQDSRVFVESCSPEAVKLLTIHKAKGLEFAAVIIPFLELDINELGASANKGAIPYVLSRDLDGLSLVRVDKKYAVLSDPVAELYRDSYRKAFIDELNAIYVAFTRARDELYVFIPSGSQRSNNAARFLVPAGSLEKGTQENYPGPSLNAVSFEIPCSEYKDWIEALEDEFMDMSSLANRDRIREGEVIHFLLSCVGNADKEDIKKALEEGMVSAKARFPRERDLDGYAERIISLVEGKDTRKFFHAGSAVVFREKDVVDASGRSRRIDRLLIMDDESWIIDYKSGAEPSGLYKQQLENYRQIVRDIYPGKKTRCFAVFLDKLFVEEI